MVRAENSELGTQKLIFWIREITIRSSRNRSCQTRSSRTRSCRTRFSGLGLPGFPEITPKLFYLFPDPGRMAVCFPRDRGHLLRRSHFLRYDGLRRKTGLVQNGKLRRKSCKGSFINDVTLILDIVFPYPDQPSPLHIYWSFQVYQGFRLNLGKSSKMNNFGSFLMTSKWATYFEVARSIADVEFSLKPNQRG